MLRTTVCLFAFGALLALPRAASASSFTGYAETGWEYDNKGYCCEDALQAAQDDGARACERVGGHPTIRRGSVRGRCDWDASRDPDGRRVYSCTATVSVSCR